MSWNLTAQAARELFKQAERPELMQGPQGRFTLERFLKEAARWFAGEYHLARLRTANPQAVEATFDGDVYRFMARGEACCVVEPAGKRWAVVDDDADTPPTYPTVQDALAAAYRKTHQAAHSSSIEDLEETRNARSKGTQKASSPKKQSR